MLIKAMSKILRIMQIHFDSIVDGEGLRDVLFLNLCPHHCFNCHNIDTWDYNNGVEFTIEQIYHKLINNKNNNVTYSGGEPFLQCEALSELSKVIKENTDKNIWIYSGYSLEEILEDPVKKHLLERCDVIVDGKYIDALKDESLLFRGSSNQKIIDIQKTLLYGKTILWEPK